MMASFTLFIVLPSEDVCSLHGVTSGADLRHIRCRLELMAGLPAQIYHIKSSSGKVLADDHVLEFGKNVWDGYLLRTQVMEEWRPVYDAVLNGNISSLLRHLSASLHPRRPSLSDDQVEMSVAAGGCGAVALYLASWVGSCKLCQDLIAVGVDPNSTTPYNRTPIFAAVTRDHDPVLETLLMHGASLSITDCLGDTPLGLARRSSSRQCVNRIRTYQLVLRGHMDPRSVSPSEVSVGSFRRSPSNEKLWSPSNEKQKFPSNEKLSVDTCVSSLKLRPQTAVKVSDRTKYRPQTSKVYHTKNVTDLGSQVDCRSVSQNGISKHLGLHLTNGITVPGHLRVNQLPVRVPGPPSVMSSPRGSSVTTLTPRSPSGMKFRVAVPSKNMSPSKSSLKNQHVVTWNDPLTEYEYLSVTPRHSENKVQTRPQSAVYLQGHSRSDVSLHTGHGQTANAVVDTAENRPVNGHGDESRVDVASKLKDSTQGVEETEASHTQDDVTNTGGAGEELDSRQHGKHGQDSRVRFHDSPPRFRYRPRSHKRTESLKTAKRRIQLSENQKRAHSHTADLKKRETFDQWLERKRKQEREASDDDSSDESSDDSNNERNEQAFQDWLKEIKDRPIYQTNPKSAASLHFRKTRALHGLVGIEDRAHSQSQPAASVDTSSYMHALDEWKLRQQKSRDKQKTTTTDAKEAKKVLEEKREQLLAMAISFDEWLTHKEESNQLMKVIHEADSKKLKDIEKEKFSTGQQEKRTAGSQKQTGIRPKSVRSAPNTRTLDRSHETQRPSTAVNKKRNVWFEP